MQFITIFAFRKEILNQFEPAKPGQLTLFSKEWKNQISNRENLNVRLIYNLHTGTKKLVWNCCFFHLISGSDHASKLDIMNFSIFFNPARTQRDLLQLFYFAKLIFEAL